MRISEMLGEQTQINENIINDTMFRTHVCLPCIVQSYDAEKNTIECQPAIRENVILPDGTTRYIKYPMLINVPVVFPHVGNYGIKFPIKKNDEVLVIFSDLCIDNFWLKGSVQNPVELRRHDLSDGIAIPCCLSQPKQDLSLSVGIEISESDITFKNLTDTVTLSQIISGLSS